MKQKGEAGKEVLTEVRLEKKYLLLHNIKGYLRMQSMISESVLDQAMALVSGSLLHITLLLPTLPADLVKPGGFRVK